MFIFHTITEEPGHTWHSFDKISKLLKKCSMTSSSLPASMPSRLRRSLARPLGHMKPQVVNAARDFSQMFSNPDIGHVQRGFTSVNKPEPVSPFGASHTPYGKKTQ